MIEQYLKYFGPLTKEELLKEIRDLLKAEAVREKE